MRRCVVGKLHRWVQGIHMMCPTCKKLQQGVVVITNDDNSGETVDVHIECSQCSTNMLDVLTTHKKTKQEDLNV